MEFLKLKYVDNENDLKKIIPYDVRFSLPKVKNSTWSLRSEENLNVFLISHDFTHPLVDKIQIIKEKNISTVRA